MSQIESRSLRYISRPTSYLRAAYHPIMQALEIAGATIGLYAVIGLLALGIGLIVH